MPQRSNAFQELIYLIESSLSKEGTTVTQSAMVKDNLGIEREIDILIKTTINSTEVNIAVECRDYSRDQSIMWIDEIIGKYDNIPIEKKIAVSSNGFTDQAILKAKHYNIIPVSLEDALKTAWPSFLEEVLISIYRLEVGLLNSNVILKSSPTVPPTPESRIEDESGGFICRLGIWLEELYDEIGRKKINEELWESMPEFFEIEADKGTKVDLAIEPNRILFLKISETEKVQLLAARYQAICEIHFMETKNTIGVYKDNYVIKATSKIGDKRINAYGIPFQSENGFDLKIVGDQNQWKRIK